MCVCGSQRDHMSLQCVHCGSGGHAHRLLALLASCRDATAPARPPLALLIGGQIQTCDCVTEASSRALGTVAVAIGYHNLSLAVAHGSDGAAASVAAHMVALVGAADGVAVSGGARPVGRSCANVPAFRVTAAARINATACW